MFWPVWEGGGWGRVGLRGSGWVVFASLALESCQELVRGTWDVWPCVSEFTGSPSSFS